MSMVKQGMVPDAITYSALISACEKSKQPERALEVFEAMQPAMHVVRPCSGKGGRDGLLQEMVHQLLAPDVVSFTAYINACEKGKQCAGALGSLQEIVPNVIT